MKVHPIIFSGPMVRALLEGRKTQTRRLATSPLARVKPGDLLYVREAHYVESAGYKDGSGRRINYRASHPDAPNTWTPSIHMPRWASRLTLEVTATKVERLHEISPQDAIAESIDYEKHRCGCERCATTSIICPASASSLILDFAELWDTVHEPGAWDANPEIVALTFRVHEKNIDQFLKAEAA